MKEKTVKSNIWVLFQKCLKEKKREQKSAPSFQYYYACAVGPPKLSGGIIGSEPGFTFFIGP
jgi:hypothetical protein